MPPNFIQYGSALEIRDIARYALNQFDLRRSDAESTGSIDVLEAYFSARESLEYLVEKTSKIINEYKESKQWV